MSFIFRRRSSANKNEDGRGDEENVTGEGPMGITDPGPLPYPVSSQDGASAPVSAPPASPYRPAGSSGPGPTSGSGLPYSKSPAGGVPVTVPDTRPSANLDANPSQGLPYPERSGDGGLPYPVAPGAASAAFETPPPPYSIQDRANASPKAKPVESPLYPSQPAFNPSY